MSGDRPAIVGELSRLIGAEHVLKAQASSPYNSDSSNRRGVEGRAQAVGGAGTEIEYAAQECV